MSFAWTPEHGRRVDMRRCRASVRDDGPWPRFHQCLREGKIKEDGILWCSLHAPSAEAKKEAQRKVKWLAQENECRRKHNREVVEKKIVALAVNAFQRGELSGALKDIVSKYEEAGG